jgi:hypothetical protein
MHLHCVVDGALESKVATTMLTAPLYTHYAPRHDVTAALSGLAAQKHEQGFGATSTQPVCMLDDATVHIEGAASCGYRYTPRCVQHDAPLR